MYADCLIADAWANGGSTSMFLSSIEASMKFQKQPTPFEHVFLPTVDSGASNMDCDSALGNDAPDVASDGARNLICDGCDIVLPSSALSFRCTSCPNFDLCVPCHAKYEHCQDCHEFVVANTQTPVPTRSLCSADAHLSTIFALPAGASLLNEPSLTKAKVLLAECRYLQRRLGDCESMCRQIIQVMFF
jgi:hypothetical protein